MFSFDIAVSTKPSPSVRAPLRWPAATVAALIVVAAAVFGWALIAQHRALGSRAYDLAYFDQVIWNTSQGRWFATTFVEFNFLGEHFSPVLLLFAGLYRLGGNIELVLALQAMATAAAAAPLYLAARRLLRSPVAGLLIAAAYLLSPHLHEAVLFDFHPELFGIAIVFAAFALLVADRPRAALFTFSALFLLKEDAALVGIGFAWVVWLRGYRRPALALAGGSLVYAVVVMGVVMPALRGDAPGLMGRYGYLGESLPEIVVGVVTRPDVVWRQLSGPDPRAAVARLLGALALLPLAGPAALAAAPALLANLLSAHPPQMRLSGHYATYPFALLVVAAVLGAARLCAAGWLRRRWAARLPLAALPIALAALLLTAQALAWFAWSPFGRRFESAKYQVTPHMAAVKRAIALIPAEAPVSAQSNLLPHLSQRWWLRDFPRLDGVEYVLVDFKSWGMWQTTFEIYAEVYESLPSLGFCEIHEEDGVHLWRRLDTCPPPPPGSISRSLPP